MLPSLLLVLDRSDNEPTLKPTENTTRTIIKSLGGVRDINPPPPLLLLYPFMLYEPSLPFIWLQLVVGKRRCRRLILYRI